jgi:RNA 2',3'-cyclic 3'-phosphodiesterase
MAGIGPGARFAATPDGGQQPAESGDVLRLFIAVPLPDDVRDVLAEVVEPVRSAVDARWQSPATWHLTLRFLGDTPATAVPGVIHAVRHVAAQTRSFRVGLSGAGCFGRGGGRGVAWIGVEPGARELVAVAAALGTALDPAGAASERPLHSHLTLAREASDAAARALRAAIAGAPRLSWNADRLVLFRSVLGRGGAVHSEVASASFEGL